MNEKNITIPTTIIENKTWILLKEISHSWIIRAAGMGKSSQVKEPSDHRAWDVGVEGAVKCRPKAEWDITKYKPK